MNDQYFDHCMRKAVEKYIDSQAEPDSERLWRRIEALIDTYESNKSVVFKTRRPLKNLFIKIAVSLAVALIILGAISFTSIGEALPASFPLRNFFRKLVTETQMIIQFNTKDNDLPKDTRKPDFEGVYEIEPPQYGFIETNFEDLVNFYEGNLYMPTGIPLSRLQKLQYSEAGNLWTILMDFRINDVNILFSQKDTGEGGYYGMGYDAEDTDLTMHQIDGIQYLVYKRRYNIVEVDWFMHDKVFNITGNLPVEEALSLARSVEIYKP